jgi:hypothetical protein
VCFGSFFKEPPLEYLGFTHPGTLMNRQQKLVLIAGLIAILAMGVFPPWIRSDRDHVQRPSGYSFVLQSPNQAVDDLLANGPVTYQIDVPHLTLQWALMLLLVSVVVLYLKPERRRRTARVVALRRT